MTIKRSIIVFLLLLSGAGCITKFVPETGETDEMIVVEGLLTDQEGPNTVIISKSLPLGKVSSRKPLRGCTVRISDDSGNNYLLTEQAPGTYTTYSRGMLGRKYTLEIQADHLYRSLPVEMKPVPPIDSLFYQKVTIADPGLLSQREEGCQIYLNTNDPEGKCKFFRWDYTETWEFRLPYAMPVNRICWITLNSPEINIKNTSGLSENKIFRFPLKFVSNKTDRLKVKYSIMVNQYSLNEDEFVYWEKLQNVSEETGGLYDITPSSIPGNIYCVDDPAEKVLGYFSVSAETSRRLFIKENFLGVINLYTDCISDTIYGRNPIQGLDSYIWILDQDLYALPPFTIVTEKKGCADCTVRGSTTRPDFWDGSE